MIKAIQQIIARLRREYHAQKQAYQATATTVDLVTKTLEFSTSKNACHYSSGGISFDYEENERVVVTFNTTEGVNTLAKLEITTNADVLPIVRRVPYTGGARWVVSNAPKVSGGAWQSTHYSFVVRSLVNGALSAKMIWE